MNKKSWLAVATPVIVASAGLMFFSTLSSGQAAYAEEKINWSHEFKASKDKAISEHKFMLADVYTDWCGWCKRLDKDVFSDPDMAKFLSANFVCVKVNAEDAKEGQKVAEEFKVNGYPCALVFDGSGKFVGQISGYMDASHYQKRLEEMQKGAQ